MKAKCWAAAVVSLACAVAQANEAVDVARGDVSRPPKQPQLAIDGKGAIHLVFGVGDSIRYAVSSDEGATFSSPVELPSGGVMALGMRRGPRIAATDSAICVTAIGGEQGKGRDGDVLAWRSSDRGRTWSGPVKVNDVPGSAREGLHAMAASAQGQLVAVWLDLRSGKTEIMAATSDDGGETWGKNVLVYRSPDGSVCECCHPSVAYDARGQMFVQWRNSLGGDRDIYFASSSDGGASFSEAKKLGRGAWQLDACPMDGGAIAVASPGKYVSAWRREGAVYLSLAGQPQERLLGGGEQPWVAATTKGAYVVWLTKRSGPVLLSKPDAGKPIQLAKTANDPVIASGPAGSGPVAVAWESSEGGQAVIRCQVVSK